EIKFGDQYFAKSDLNKGSAWTTATATNLYQKHLKKLKLPAEVAATFARERAKQVLSSAVFPTFVLWSLGDDMRDLKMSARALSTHRRSILEKMGYDILKAASATFSTEWKVNAAAVFNWENRIDVNAMKIDELWHLGAPATDNHRTVLQ
ncbi:MAG: hypothetical protein Q8M96_12985, partial [Rubrivivax sp.]|nr:hypothetical protein [Rubrivivax sp.]